jgi:hypothetical protein
MSGWWNIPAARLSFAPIQDTTITQATSHLPGIVTNLTAGVPNPSKGDVNFMKLNLVE